MADHDCTGLETSVAFLVFNRPDTTRRVFDAIRAARPRRLFIAADGPRPNRPGEDEKCHAVRAIVERVDWDCEVHRDFSEVNLGCKRRVVSALNWVFDHNEEAIILEDDCVPHPTFFPYCHELLERYRHDSRVMAISGDNFLRGVRRSDDSYFFSRYVHIWGWASWRRAWALYDPDLKLWPKVRDGGWLNDIFRDPELVAYWQRTVDFTYEGNLDTWDYQWIAALWIHSGLAVIPYANLVSNVGFGPDASHTVAYTPYAEKALEAMKFPLKHPSFMIRNASADAITEENFFLPPKFPERVRRKLQRVIRAYRRSQ